MVFCTVGCLLKCDSMCMLHAQVRYLGLVEKLKELMVDPVYDLNAAVYTELSDVEAEINGLITYDRQVMLQPSYAFT